MYLSCNSNTHHVVFSLSYNRAGIQYYSLIIPQACIHIFLQMSYTFAHRDISHIFHQLSNIHFCTRSPSGNIFGKVLCSNSCMFGLFSCNSYRKSTCHIFLVWAYNHRRSSIFHRSNRSSPHRGAGMSACDNRSTDHKCIESIFRWWENNHFCKHMCQSCIQHLFHNQGCILRISSWWILMGILGVQGDLQGQKESSVHYPQNIPQDRYPYKARQREADSPHKIHSPQSKESDNWQKCNQFSCDQSALSPAGKFHRLQPKGR